MNRFFAIGNLGGDADIISPKMSKFSLGVKSGYGDNKTTQWLSCVLRGEKRQSIVKYLTKGRSVFIEGEIEITKKDDRYYTNIVLSKVELLGDKQEAQTNNLPFN